MTPDLPVGGAGLPALLILGLQTTVVLRTVQYSTAVLDSHVRACSWLCLLSGVFEVYTSELRARQLEVEKRCKEVRVLQGIVRNMGGQGRPGWRRGAQADRAMTGQCSELHRAVII